LQGCLIILLVKYGEVINFYFVARIALKKGWLKGAKLEGEKVILSSDFLKEEGFEPEELAEAFEGIRTRNGVIVSFD